MKMIKINSDHYVLTDGEKPKEGEWGVGFALGHKGKGRGWFMFHHDGSAKAKLNAICEGSFRITHSTEPLDIVITEDNVQLPDWSKVKPLSPRVVHKIIPDKLYTEADLRKAFEAGVSAEAGDKPEGYSYKLGIPVVDYVIQSLQNRTEWDVEFVDGLLTLKK